MLLHKDAQKSLTMGTLGGLYMPTQVPQGVSNATGHFQTSMEDEVLDGMIGEKYLVWVNDIIFRGRARRELLLNVLNVMQ